MFSVYELIHSQKKKRETYEENDNEDSNKPERENNTESNTKSNPKHKHWLKQKSQIIV